MLKSTLLSGNARLEKASLGPPSIRKRPPDDDPDAVRRIQKALVRLGFNLPKSFPNGPKLEPDGLFGPETETAVREFQKKAFPKTMSEWDGRCGPKTLSAMDQRLANDAPAKGVYIPPRMEIGTCRCQRGSPAEPGRKRAIPSLKRAATPPGVPIPYPNTGKASHTAHGSKKVKIARKMLFKNSRPAISTRK